MAVSRLRTPGERIALLRYLRDREPNDPYQLHTLQLGELTEPSRGRKVRKMDYEDTTLVIDATEEEIRNEPMLFSTSGDRAWLMGGPITKRFLNELEKAEPSGGCVIDTRSHMLMPGQYPCIPGWHLDSIPRPNGQPDLSVNRPLCRHYLCVIGPSAMTEFLDTPFNGEGHDPLNVYGSCNRILDGMGIVTTRVQSGHIYRFGDRAWHRGTSSDRNCWRWFIRASFGDGRTPRNEIRKQTQVYADINGGW